MYIIYRLWTVFSKLKRLQKKTFLERLLPGDMILADIRFNIEESVELMCAVVKIHVPAFTKGKKQLSVYYV